MKESKIALGTWAWGTGAFGGDSVFGNKTNEDTLRLVFETAMKAGLNLWDTATVYGMGESERILGTFVKDQKRENVIVSTKFTPQIADIYDNSVERMAEASMKRMGLDYIDIYWIHNPMDIERWTPGLIPLLKSGKVKSIGVSNHNLDEILRANEILLKEGFKISAVQNHFSLLYRSSEKTGIIDYCKQNGIDFWAYMVLEQGALSGKYNKANPLPEESDRGIRYNPVLDRIETLTNAMKVIGEKHGISCSQVGMAWAIAKGAQPLIGVTKAHQVFEAADAVRVQLSKKEVEQLEQIADTTGVDTRGDWEHIME